MYATWNEQEYEATQQRSWFGAFVYWNRRNKYYMKALPKAIWWIKFVFIGALLPEGLVDALSAIPILGTPLWPVDVAELPSEGIGGAFLAWLFLKMLFKLPATWRALKEISAMRDPEQYPSYQWSRWMPSWLPE